MQQRVWMGSFIRGTSRPFNFGDVWQFRDPRKARFWLSGVGCRVITAIGAFRAPPLPPPPQLGFQRVYTIQPRDDAYFEVHPFGELPIPSSSVSPCSVPRWLVLCLSDRVRSRRFLRPHPAFFQLLLQANHLSKSTLAWRLGGPWATLGPPKGHPNPKSQIPIPIPIPIPNPKSQSQSQSQSGRGSQAPIQELKANG